MAILSQILLVLVLIVVLCFNNPVLAVSKQNTLDIFKIGLENVRQNNYQQALVDFTQIIDRQDDLIGAAYSNRCLVNLQLQNNTAAESDCIEALKNNSDNLEAYLNLGLAYYRQGKYQQAIAQYQQVIQRDEQDHRAYYNRGLAYLARKDYQSAIADFQTALSFAPESNRESKSLIYNDLALAQMMLAEDESAVFNFSKAIALNSNNYDAYFNRGCAHHRQRNYQAAIDDFTRVVELNPDFTQVYVNRAILRHEMEQTDAAFKDLNIALKQYQSQGDRQKYDLVVSLKQMLFYSQPSRLV